MDNSETTEKCRREEVLFVSSRHLGRDESNRVIEKLDTGRYAGEHCFLPPS